MFALQNQARDITESCQRRPHLIGYFHYPEVDRRRRQELRPRRHPGGGRNAPGQALSLKKLSDITPQEWFHDPYLLCILISMVQSLKGDPESPQQIITAVCRLLRAPRRYLLCRVALDWRFKYTNMRGMTDC